MSTNSDVTLDERIKNTTYEPTNYNVIMINDDHTPMEWVMGILKTIFKHSDASSESLTMAIHNEGSAVVGTYKYEIAEQKALETMSLSQTNGFPLQTRVDEES